MEVEEGCNPARSLFRFLDCLGMILKMPAKQKFIINLLWMQAIKKKTFHIGA